MESKITTKRKGGKMMDTYQLEMRDGSGATETIEIDAVSREAAIEEVINSVQGHADDWCAGGAWGNGGACVEIGWTLTDEAGEEIESGGVTVAIEPDHEYLISEAVGQWDLDSICGTDPDDHDWTSKGEGGCDENPGVWATGGTSMVFASHCRACGLHRTEHHTGSQRNPGDHDTTEYRMLDEDEIRRHKQNGTMDAQQNERVER